MSYTEKVLFNKPAPVQWFNKAYPEVYAEFVDLRNNYCVYQITTLDQNTVSVTKTFPDFARYQQFNLDRESWPSYHQLVAYNLQNNITATEYSSTNT